jgi:hypothetical protein
MLVLRSPEAGRPLDWSFGSADRSAEEVPAFPPLLPRAPSALRRAHTPGGEREWQQEP